MIKAKVVSLTINEAIGVVKKLDFETYIEEKDSVCLNSFFEAMPWDGLDAVIMTEEEYKAMDSASDGLRENLLDEREKTRKLQEENDKLKRENNEKEGEICKLIVNNDIEQLRLKEKIRKLEEENEAIQKDIKDLEEKMAQEAAEIDIHPDGTIVFRSKKVSELEKKVKELEEKNKYLKKRLMTRYTVNFDADGAIIYPESKED